MPQACNYGCADLPDHEQVVCGAYLKGGVSALGVLSCDHSITNFSDPADIQDAIDDGKLVIIKEVNGEIPAPSPVKTDNPSGRGPLQKLDTFDRTVVVIDSNVTSANIDFIDALNVRSAMLLVYHPEDQMLTVIENRGNFVAFRITPKPNQQRMTFQITYEWTSLSEPALVDAAALADIFEG